MSHGNPHNQMEEAIDPDLIAKYIKYEEFGFIYLMFDQKRMHTFEKWKMTMVL
jgi:hypothetical protein